MTGALEGIRVLDLTAWQAGPTVTMVLGDMGAEVIKIEAIQRLDGWRGAGDAYELTPNWNGLNRNKLGLTLDLTQPDGKGLFERLVAQSDIVVENYTPRVMENFGLGYPVLAEINPRIIMLSLSGFGATGPWRDFLAFAFPTEEMSGLAQLTGYEGGPPELIGPPVTDALAGMMGTFSILTALEYRRRTGCGQYIDCSQIEALTGMIGGEVMSFTMNGRVEPRRGNRHEWMAPHGVYPCAGDDRWVAIAVGSDQQWRALCDSLGESALGTDERFASASGRHAHQAEIDERISRWTAARTHYDAMHVLQAAGVPAGAVLTPSELLVDPQLNARGFFQVLDRGPIGTYPYPGPAFKLSATPGELRRPAPFLGEHNGYVLRDLLGLSDEEIAALESKQVIGTKPLPQTWR